MYFIVVFNCIWIHTDILNFVELMNGVQLQKLILECGTTGIYLKFTFMKSACHKLSGDIKIVLGPRSNQELCFFEYQRKFVPDFTNWWWPNGLVVITVAWIDTLLDVCQYAFSEFANCIFLRLPDQYQEKQQQNVFYLFIFFFSLIASYWMYFIVVFNCI